MKPDTEVAISWIELIMIVLLVVGGMSVWVFVDHQVGIALKHQEPREEQFQQICSVPARQSELSVAQAELKATQEELTEQRLELARQTSMLESMSELHPELLDAVTAAASVPLEVLQTYIDTQVKRESTLQLIDSLSADLNAAISTTLELSSTVQAQKPGTQEYSVAEMNLSWAQSKMAGLQEKLIEQQLELLRQTSSIDSLTVVYPKLSIMPLMTVPPQTLQDYIEMKDGLDATTRLIDLLNAKLAVLSASIGDRSFAVAKAQQSAAGEYAQAQENFSWSRRLRILSFSAGGVLLLLLLAFGLVSWLVSTGEYRINKALVFGSTIAIVCVLFAYQVLLAVGAALIGTLILGLVLGYMSKHISKANLTSGSGGNP